MEEENRRVEENLNLIHHLLKKYKWIKKEDYDDYFQCGAYGLCLAARRFDESKGFAFSTFACVYIEQCIKRHLRDFAQGPIRPTRTYVDGKEVMKKPKYLYCDGVVPGEEGKHQPILEKLDTGVLEEDEIITIIDFKIYKDKLYKRDALVIDLLTSGIGQMETSKIVGISQAQISRIKRKVQTELKLALEG